MQMLYDQIGATYGSTRRADPGVAQTLAERIGASHGQRYLDVGCGTGNYTCAVAAHGGQWFGIDPSAEMLEQARVKSNRVCWTRGSAQALPFADGGFSGVICTLAIHHFQSTATAFAETFRVLRAGKLVLFTAFPDQMRNYWLCRYFPEMMQRSIDRMPSRALVIQELKSAGFSEPLVTPFYVTNELQDLFLYSGKLRPELYLERAVRLNISSFATLCPPLELEQGLLALRSDILNNRFQAMLQEYPIDQGDYAFVTATKMGF
jgi:ubiquinone/menaquinone biosynthesis C-methylase UbiE